MNLVGGAARLDRWARNIIPIVITLFLVLISVTPIPVPYSVAIAPSLPLMAVYYWVVLRPELMPRTAVFAIGLVHDALSGVPLGVNALVLLLTHAILSSQRRYLVGKSFWLFWLGFVILAPAAGALTWALMSILRGTLVAPDATLFNLLMTIAVFPLLAWILFHTQRALVGQGD
ncbi:MAG: rod shape-determining protein MreD [Alphaproteobacteria bacterium]